MSSEMHEEPTKIPVLPEAKTSVTTLRSPDSQEQLPSGSALLAIPSEQLCPKCKDFKALTREERDEAALDKSEQEEPIQIDALPKITVTALKSPDNQEQLPSESTTHSVQSEQLCPKCKDIYAVPSQQSCPEDQNKQEAALDKSEQEEGELRGTESTDTIVAFPHLSKTKFMTVSEVLTNMATDTTSMESIHELLPKKEPKIEMDIANNRQSTTVEKVQNALRSTDTKRVSYFDDEGFKMYDLKIVTSLTDLDTLKNKSVTDEDSPRVSFTFQEPVS